jgi:spore maturation protein CgeB
VELLGALTEKEARRIGLAARRRVLSEHTYFHRALEVERTLGIKGHPSASIPAEAGQ